MGRRSVSDRPTIAVAGLGTMGLGIAQLFAAAGFPVRAHDSVPQTCANARDRMAHALDARVAAGKLAPADRDATLARMTVVTTPEDLAPADLVIEAVIEDIDAKRALLARIERSLGAGSVLATNTSSLSISNISAGLSRPERLVSLHFFNPPTAMRLVELATHSGSDADAAAFARKVCEAVGKTVIDCPDRPGFIVNRCARPFYGEALAMLEEGRAAREIDAAMLAAGYRLGPLSLIDLIGADVNLAATEGLSRAMASHPRYHVFGGLRRQVAAGRLGRKTGSGFLHPGQPGPAPADAKAIALRIEATLINEAGWLLAEGGVTGAGIDIAMKLGLNFPRGPFEALASHGKDRIAATLARLERAAPAHLKGRYRPAPILEAT